MLVLEKDFIDTNCKRLKHAMSYSIVLDGNMYIKVYSLIKINNIATDSIIITLRKVDLKQYICYKLYVDKDLIKDNLYEIIDQFNNRKITPVKIH